MKMFTKRSIALFVFLLVYSFIFSQTSIKSLFQNGNKIFIGTNYGVYLENEKEFEWKNFNHGLPDGAEMISMEKFGNHIFCADQEGGLFSIFESDTVWKKINSLSSEFKQIISLRKNDTALFVIDSEKGIAYTTDDGFVWKYLDILKQLNASNEKNNIDENIKSEKKNKSGKKKDETETIKTNKIKITDLYFSDDGILAGVSSPTPGCGLYKSMDKGKTWQEASFDLNRVNVKKIYGYKGKIYLLTSGLNGAIYKSENSGSNWEKLSKPPIPWVTLFLVDENKLYAGNHREGLCVTYDDGIIWKKMDCLKTGAEQTIDHLIKTNNGIYVGTSDGIVILREKNGVCEIVKEGLKTKKNDSFFYADIGTKNGVTLHANKYSDEIIFKVENTTSKKIKVLINLIFECGFLNAAENSKLPKQKIEWLIIAEPNSTISYDTDPKSCSVSSCKEKTIHWEITDWKVE